MKVAIKCSALVAATIATIAAGSGAALATTINLNYSTYTVTGSGSTAFCGAPGAKCDFSTPTGGSATGTVTTLAPTGIAGGIPTGTGVNGVNGSNQLEWWTPGTYGTTTVAAIPGGTGSIGPVTPSSTVPTPLGTGLYGGPFNLFTDATFFSGANDVGHSLTAAFAGTIQTTSAGTLVFTGNVDDNVLIYLNTGSGYVLYPTTPANFSNQPDYGFADSISLGTGTYGIEIFYADRASTQAIFDLNASYITTAVPEASTWAMMILGFLGVGFMAYRRKGAAAFRLV
jgi:hypothetical protein